MRDKLYQETWYMMKSYFYFHVSIEVLLILQKLELQLFCVCFLEVASPKSNKMLNKNKIKYFGPYKNGLILSNAALYLVH